MAQQIKTRRKNTWKLFIIAGLSGLVVFLIVVISIMLIQRPETKFGTVTINGREFTVEIANSPVEREVGLMYRKSLPEMTGMLFLFDHPEIQSFWMRNTYVSLDIIFIDDQKRIINICTMPPLTDQTCQSERPAPYVLELEAGSAAKYGLTSGQAVAMSLPQ